MFRLLCLPLQEYFTDVRFPARLDEVNAVVAPLQSQLEGVVLRLHGIFSSLVRHKDASIRDSVIKWLNSCFTANADRGKVSTYYIRGVVLIKRRCGLIT